MKTGEIAKLIGRNARTIINWVDEFPNYFSATARAGGRTHKIYDDSDKLVLNTIRHLRDSGYSPSQIEDELSAGFRHTEFTFDQVFASTDTDAERFALSLRVAAQRDELVKALEDKENEIALLKDENTKLRQDKLSDQREIGRLEGQIEMLREMLKMKN